MPKTLFEKIWDAHLVATRMDGRELIYIDRHVLHELHAPHAFESLEKQGRPVRRPDLTFSMQDHTVSTQQGRTDNSNPEGAPFLRAMREGSRKNGIRVFDLGDPEQGISHVVAPEIGMVLPGATHAVPDFSRARFVSPILGKTAPSVVGAPGSGPTSARNSWRTFRAVPSPTP